MQTFALHPVVGGQCGCGDEACDRAGKHPAERWGELPERPELTPTETQGVGIATGARSGVFVVDLDVKNGVDGVASLGALGPVPETYTVATPSGGFHLYYRHPGFPVRNSGPKSNPLGPGIDMRGDGGYVVAPGSPHKNGGRYAVHCAAPIAEAPAWLLAWPGLRKPEGSTLAAPATDVEARVAQVPRDWRVGKAQAWLAQQPPAVEHQGGDAHTFKLLTRAVHDWCLTDADMIDEAFAPWNSRCEPPWTGSQWSHKVNSALNHSTVEWKTAELLMKRKLEEVGTALTITLPTPTTQPEWGVVDWDFDDPPVEWLVQGVIQAATVSLAFGLPNSLKTWTTYLIASAVSKGEPWLGRGTKQGLVVLLDYESSPRQARRRMRLLKQQGLSSLRYVNPTEMLDDMNLWQRLAALKPALVIADSLSRGMIGREENDPTAAVPLDAAKRLARSCGTSTVFIHHKNKAAAEGQTSVRGSGAIAAAAEGWLEFLDFERFPGGVQRARLHCGRLKESVGFDDMTLELSDANGLVEVKAPTQGGVSKSELTIEEVKSRLLLQLQNAPEGLGADTLLREAGCRGGEAKYTATRALKELVDSGSVSSNKAGKGHRYRARKAPEEQRRAIITVISSGVGGEAEILRLADADEEHFRALAAERVIYRSGGVWLLAGRSPV